MLLYHRSDALLCEQFNQQGMGQTAINNRGLRDAPAHGGDTGVHLRDHAFVDMAVGDKLPGVGGRHFANQAVFVGEVLVNAFHVGHHHQRGRTECDGQFSGDGVGVDIIAFTVFADGNAGNDRDVTRPGQRVQAAPD